MSDVNPFDPGDPHHAAWEATRDDVQRLNHVHAVFRRWLGASYDIEALDVVLAAAVAGAVDFTGDPVWLLVISGSGNAKTETVSALSGRAIVTSTVSSEGALLSAVPIKEHAKDATGGLLRRLGGGGLLVIKDFTSILSMGREIRAGVLAALREVYDGFWARNVGTDGGRTLTWRGRVGLIGAVTTAYDSAHGVIAAMGDRFALVRMDSSAVATRVDSGHQAMSNVGSEHTMRAELAESVSKLLANIGAATELSNQDIGVLFPAADLVTLARTGVERDFQGNVLDAHAPEMPTRFAKQLGQIVRGAVALGVDRTRAWRLALRVARDTVPPMRLLVLLDVMDHPASTTKDVVHRVQKPRTTVDRTLQELHVIGLLKLHDDGGAWRYSLADTVNQATLNELRVNTPTTDKSGAWTVPEMSVGVQKGQRP